MLSFTLPPKYIKHPLLQFPLNVDNLAFQQKIFLKNQFKDYIFMISCFNLNFLAVLCMNPYFNYLEGFQSYSKGP